MQFNWLLQLLGWLPLPLLAALAVVLSWRKAYRDFPLFYGYVLTATASTVARLVAFRVSYTVYYFVYWISDLLLFVLGLVVIYDLFARRLFGGYQRVRFYRYALPIALLVVLGLTVTAIETPNRTTIFLIASRVLTVLIVGLLAFFGGLMLFLGRRWTDYEIGIASGFALSHCVQFIVAMVRVKLRYRTTIIDQFPAWAYDVACVLWLVYCWKVPEKRAPAIELEWDWLTEVKRLEQQLLEWFRRRRYI